MIPNAVISFLEAESTQAKAVASLCCAGGFIHSQLMYWYTSLQSAIEATVLVMLEQEKPFTRINFSQSSCYILTAETLMFPALHCDLVLPDALLNKSEHFPWQGEGNKGQKTWAKNVVSEMSEETLSKISCAVSVVGGCDIVRFLHIRAMDSACIRCIRCMLWGH